MTKAEIIALAERVEGAEGPDRELDAKIALSLGIVTERDGNTFYGHKDYSCMVLERGYYDHGGHAPELPHYTASLDAAMTLVPEQSLWSVCDMEEGPFAQVIRLWDRERYFRSRASTPALALTAAALRAIAEEMDG